MQPVVVLLVDVEEFVRALGVECLHLRDDALAADRRAELLPGDLATENGPRGMLHGLENDRPRVDQRAVEVEEDDREAHGAIVARRLEGPAKQALCRRSATMPVPQSS